MADVGLGNQGEGLADRDWLVPLAIREGLNEMCQQLGRAAIVTGTKMALNGCSAEVFEPLTPHYPDLDDPAVQMVAQRRQLCNWR